MSEITWYLTTKSEMYFRMYRQRAREDLGERTDPQSCSRAWIYTDMCNTLHVPKTIKYVLRILYAFEKWNYKYGLDLGYYVFETCVAWKSQLNSYSVLSLWVLLSKWPLTKLSPKRQNKTKKYFHFTILPVLHFQGKHERPTNKNTGYLAAVARLLGHGESHGVPTIQKKQQKNNTIQPNKECFSKQKSIILWTHFTHTRVSLYGGCNPEIETSPHRLRFTVYKHDLCSSGTMADLVLFFWNLVWF